MIFVVMVRMVATFLKGVHEKTFSWGGKGSFLAMDPLNGNSPTFRAGKETQLGSGKSLTTSGMLQRLPHQSDDFSGAFG